MKPEIYSFIIAIKIARQIWFRHGWMIAMISKVSDSINRLECALMKCGVSARDHFPKWFRCSSEGFRRSNHWFHIPKTWWTLVRNDRPKLALYQSCVPLTSQFHQNVVVWMAIGNYYLKKGMASGARPIQFCSIPLSDDISNRISEAIQRKPRMLRWKVVDNWHSIWLLPTFSLCSK